jgi:hypothetical protein
VPSPASLDNLDATELAFLNRLLARQIVLPPTTSTQQVEIIEPLDPTAPVIPPGLTLRKILAIIYGLLSGMDGMMPLVLLARGSQGGLRLVEPAVQSDRGEFFEFLPI